jgi:hypothetical protein
LQSGAPLIGRFWSAKNLTVDSGPIEAANASLSSREHFAGILDPAHSCLALLGFTSS